MATVIDSLILEFSLDASKFTRGQQEVMDRAGKLEEAARKAGEATESQAKRTAESFQNIKRGALDVIAAFAGFKGITGLIEGTTKSMTDLGLAAQRFNMDPRLLSGWEGAVQKLGGSPMAARAAFEGLNQSILQTILTGQVPQGLGFLSRIAGVRDPSSLNNPNALARIFLEAADTLRKEMPTEGQRRQALMNIPGMTPEMAQLLLQSRASIEASVKDSEELRGVTKQLTESSRDLTGALARTGQAIEGGGNRIMAFIDGPLTQFFNWFADFLKAHPAAAGPLALAEQVHEKGGWVGDLAIALGLRALWRRGGAAAVTYGARAAGAAVGLGTGVLPTMLGPLGWFFGMTGEAGDPDEVRRVQEKLRRGTARETGAARPSKNLSDADVTFVDASGRVVTLPRTPRLVPPGAAAGPGGGGGVNVTVETVNVNAPHVRDPNEATAAGVEGATRRRIRPWEIHQFLSQNRGPT